MDGSSQRKHEIEKNVQNVESSLKITISDDEGTCVHAGANTTIPSVKSNKNDLLTTNEHSSKVRSEEFCRNQRNNHSKRKLISKSKTQNQKIQKHQTCRLPPQDIDSSGNHQVGHAQRTRYKQRASSLRDWELDPIVAFLIKNDQAPITLVGTPCRYRTVYNQNNKNIAITLPKRPAHGDITKIWNIRNRLNPRSSLRMRKYQEDDLDDFSVMSILTDGILKLQENTMCNDCPSIPMVERKYDDVTSSEVAETIIGQKPISSVCESLCSKSPSVLDVEEYFGQSPASNNVEENYTEYKEEQEVTLSENTLTPIEHIDVHSVSRLHHDEKCQSPSTLRAVLRSQLVLSDLISFQLAHLNEVDNEKNPASSLLRGDTPFKDKDSELTNNTNNDSPANNYHKCLETNMLSPMVIKKESSAHHTSYAHDSLGDRPSTRGNSRGETIELTKSKTIFSKRAS
eukprot:15325483-Ditylum_brightwellii.AAC.1